MARGGPSQHGLGGVTEERKYSIISDVIFLHKESGALIELHEKPYDSEDVFQELIERNPKVLAGGQINPDNPCRWVLLSREMGIPSAVNGGSQWFLDHLLVDQEGIPTLVEVKPLYGYPHSS